MSSDRLRRHFSTFASLWQIGVLLWHQNDKMMNRSQNILCGTSFWRWWPFVLQDRSSLPRKSPSRPFSVHIRPMLASRMYHSSLQVISIASSFLLLSYRNQWGPMTWSKTWKYAFSSCGSPISHNKRCTWLHSIHSSLYMANYCVTAKRRTPKKT